MTGLALTETAIEQSRRTSPTCCGTTADSGCLLYQAAGSIGDCAIGWEGKRRRCPWGPTLPSPLREARERLDKQIRGVCTEKYARNVLSRWERFVFPVLGGRDIREITAPELLRILRDVEEKVRAAYNHAEYPAERREMMQAWGEYFEGLGQSIEKTPQVRRFI